MASLPLPPTDYEVGWANQLVRTLSDEIDQLSQPIQVGYLATGYTPQRRLEAGAGVSAVGVVGNVSVAIDGETDATVSVTGVGGAQSPSDATLQNSLNVLATLLRDMRARGVLG